MGQAIELTAADGFKLAAYRADPAGKARGALVVAQEIFGVNSHIKSVCDGFAADGYVAIAPALFDRYERGVDIGYTPADIAKGRELKGKTTIDAALRDVAAARDAGVLFRQGRRGRLLLGRLRRVDDGLAPPGICLRDPYYGGGMLEASGEQPKCPLIAHFGERDANIPVAGVRELAAAHPEAQVYIYPADHGFNCDQRASYDAAAAKLARERTLAFLQRHVG
jgi:carboxymethylenebutenolidase